MWLTQLASLKIQLLSAVFTQLYITRHTAYYPHTPDTMPSGGLVFILVQLIQKIENDFTAGPESNTMKLQRKASPKTKTRLFLSLSDTSLGTCR